MKVETFIAVLLAIICICQSSTLVVDVVEISYNDNHTFVCNVSSSTNLTRWTYLAGPNGTSLMSYQNGTCTLSPFDSFLSDGSRYSYACNSTAYQVTVKFSPGVVLTNHILDCKDAHQLNTTRSTWVIKTKTANVSCSYCQPTLSFDVIEVTEGDNVTFVCSVPSNVSYVNWNRNIGENTTAMNVSQNGNCNTTTGKTFLDNTSKYNYTCNQTVYQVTVLNVTRSEHNDMFMCTPVKWTEGNGSNWILKVVKAQVVSVTITPSNYKINITENSILELNCTTSTARPAASVFWYRHLYRKDHNESQIKDNITTTTDYNDLSMTTSILRLFVTRQDNDTKVFCRANNAVNTTLLISKYKRLLNVIYKADDPYIPEEREYIVIENTPGTVACTVKGGNPTPTLYWGCNSVSLTNQSTVIVNGTITTLVWTPSRTHTGTCTCTSQQIYFQNETVNVTLDVLYAPSKPVFEVNDNVVTGNITIIEGYTRYIECSAESNPAPNQYVWTGPEILNNISIQSLRLSNVTKNHAGEYTCTADNTMIPSNGPPAPGINNSTVNVVVLYAPMVEEIKNISLLEGTTLNITCLYTDGIPANTPILWTRDIDDKKWNGEQLYISTIERTDTGYYICNASNVMNQTGDNTSYTGQSAQSFYLDVEYAANVTQVTVNDTIQSVTVNESEPVSFNCTADSNPTAEMTLSHESTTLEYVTSNNMVYNIARAGCLDAGTYYCSAQNVHNDGNVSTHTVQLFVNCEPRGTEEDVDINITSAKNVSITIVVDVIAYPNPVFIWRRLMNRTWTSLNDIDNFIINSTADQSNLTILNVSMEDFTSYEVNVTNKFGEFLQVYTLSPYGIPDTPTELRQIQSHTTTSSIHIEWKPGFNGGPTQTFYIKYKKSSDSSWTYFTVIDNGEETMDISLTSLAEDTQYDIGIFSSNIIGNSTELQMIVASTKATPTYLGPLIGGIAGGVTGCIIIVVVIIVVIRRYKFSDGLVDNPMYVSSGSVVRVASSSFDFNAGLVRPNETNMNGSHDVYAEVKKTRQEDATDNGYEFIDINTDNRESSVSKQIPLVKVATNASKMPNINKDGLKYADIVFKDSQPGLKKGMKDHDPTPYDLVDFSKKDEPLPDSDDDGDHKNTYWNV